MAEGEVLNMRSIILSQTLDDEEFTTLYYKVSFLTLKFT